MKLIRENVSFDGVAGGAENKCVPDSPNVEGGAVAIAEGFLHGRFLFPVMISAPQSSSLRKTTSTTYASGATFKNHSSLCILVTFTNLKLTPVVL
jgi:hypothetical protein